MSFAWTPTHEGWYDVGIEVTPVPNEDYLINNQREKRVRVLVTAGSLKVAVLDSYGTDLPGRVYLDEYSNKWYIYGEYRIMVDLTTLNKENLTLNDLNATNADALFISNDYQSPEWEFTDSELNGIIKYVREGHGLIVTSRTLLMPNNLKLTSSLGLSSSQVPQLTSFSKSFILLS